MDKDIYLARVAIALESMNILYRVGQFHIRITSDIKRTSLKAKTMGLIAHDRVMNKQKVKGWGI